MNPDKLTREASELEQLVLMAQEKLGNDHPVLLLCLNRLRECWISLETFGSTHDVLPALVRNSVWQTWLENHGFSVVILASGGVYYADPGLALLTFIGATTLLGRSKSSKVTDPREVSVEKLLEHLAANGVQAPAIGNLGRMGPYAIVVLMGVLESSKTSREDAEEVLLALEQIESPECMQELCRWLLASPQLANKIDPFWKLLRKTLGSLDTEMRWAIIENLTASLKSRARAGLLSTDILWRSNCALLALEYEHEGLLELCKRHAILPDDSCDLAAFYFLTDETKFLAHDPHGEMLGRVVKNGSLVGDVVSKHLAADARYQELAQKIALRTVLAPVLSGAGSGSASELAAAESVTVSEQHVDIEPLLEKAATGDTTARLAIEKLKTREAQIQFCEIAAQGSNKYARQLALEIPWVEQYQHEHCTILALANRWSEFERLYAGSDVLSAILGGKQASEVLAHFKRHYLTSGVPEKVVDSILHLNLDRLAETLSPECIAELVARYDRDVGQRERIGKMLLSLKRREKRSAFFRAVLRRPSEDLIQLAESTGWQPDEFNTLAVWAYIVGIHSIYGNFDKTFEYLREYIALLDDEARLVVVKRIDKGSRGTPEQKCRFFREAGLVEGLSDLNAAGVESVLKLLEDPSCREWARQVLLRLENPQGVEAVFQAYLTSEIPVLKNVCQHLCKEGIHQPQDDRQASCLYFLTGQFDRFEFIDIELLHLRQSFQNGSGPLRRRIAAQLKKSGRNDWLEKVIAFDWLPDKNSLTDPHELLTAVDALEAAQRYDELFDLMFYCRLVDAVFVLEKLIAAGWEPSTSAERQFFQQQVVLYKSGLDNDTQSLDHALPMLLRKNLVALGAQAVSAGFAPQAEFLAISTVDKKVVFWDFRQEKIVRTIDRFSGDFEKIKCVGFCAETLLLIDAPRPGRKCQLYVWNQDDGIPEVVRVFEEPVDYLATNSQQKQFATATTSGFIQGHLLVTDEKGNYGVEGPPYQLVPAEVQAITLSADASSILVLRRGFSRYEFPEIDQFIHVDCDEQICCGQFVQDSHNRFVAGLASGVVLELSIKDGTLALGEARVRVPQTNTAVAEIEVGRVFPEVTDPLEVRWLTKLHGKIVGLSFLDDCSAFWCISSRGEIALVTDCGVKLGVEYVGDGTLTVQSVVVSPCRRYMALLGSDGSLRFCDLRARLAANRLRTPLYRMGEAEQLLFREMSFLETIASKARHTFELASNLIRWRCRASNEVE